MRLMELFEGYLGVMSLMFWNLFCQVFQVQHVRREGDIIVFRSFHFFMNTWKITDSYNSQ